MITINHELTILLIGHSYPFTMKIHHENWPHNTTVCCQAHVIHELHQGRLAAAQVSSSQDSSPPGIHLGFHLDRSRCGSEVMSSWMKWLNGS